MTGPCGESDRDAGATGTDCYLAYGMSIRSDLALPELQGGFPGYCDLRIRLSSAQALANGARRDPVFEFGREAQRLSWASAGSFVIRRDSEIEITPALHADEELLRLPLLGPVMGLLLHLRGMLVLHASAVAVEGRGVVFLGDKGAGKSTLAAALLNAGHQLLADDVLAVELVETERRAVLVPAFPQLRLSSAAAEMIAGQSDLPRLIAGSDKRQFRIKGNRFSHVRTPPAHVYILKTGPRAAATLLSPQEAFGALLRFSYVGRFGKQVFRESAAGKHLRRKHLRQCATLAAQVSFRSFTVPRDLSRGLRDVVHVVEQDTSQFSPNRTLSNAK